MFKRYYLLLAYLLGIFLIVLLTACSSQTGGHPPQSLIVGKWTGECLGFRASSIEFRDDGTALVQDDVAKYTIIGNRVRLMFVDELVEYSYSISPSGNVLKLSDTRNFCLLPRAGSSGIAEIRSMIVGTWVGDCNIALFSGIEFLLFHRAVFGTNGTLTLDSGKLSYTFPGIDRYNASQPDYTSVDILISGYPEHIKWEVSEDRKTVTLTSTDLNKSCTLTRS